MASAIEVPAFPYAYLQQIDVPANACARMELHLPEVSFLNLCFIFNMV